PPKRLQATLRLHGASCGAPQAVMSHVWANAAVDRIAKVVQMPLITGETAMSGDEFVRHALESNLAAEFPVLSFDFLWDGDDHGPVRRFVSFAGFVELGAQSGYVSLLEWEGVPVLRQVLSTIMAKEAEAKASMDLRLLGALFRRLEQPASGLWDLQDAAFAS